MRVPKVEPRLETALTRFVVQEEPCNSWLTKLGEGCRVVSLSFLVCEGDQVIPKQRKVAREEFLSRTRSGFSFDF